MTVQAASSGAKRSVSPLLTPPCVGRRALSHLEKTGRFRPEGAVRAYEATPIVMEATRKAHADAESWLLSVRDGDGH